MADGVPDSEQPDRRKADALSLAINRLLQNLVIRCAKEEGVRDYFSVCVIGYGSKVGPAFSGPLAGRETVPISDVGNMPARVEQKVKKTDDGAGGILEQTGCPYGLIRSPMAVLRCAARWARRNRCHAD